MAYSKPAAVATEKPLRVMALLSERHNQVLRCFFTRSTAVKHPEARMDPPDPDTCIHTLEAPVINGECLGCLANLLALRLIKGAV